MNEEQMREQLQAWHCREIAGGTKRLPSTVIYLVPDILRTHVIPPDWRELDLLPSYARVEQAYSFGEEVLFDSFTCDRCHPLTYTGSVAYFGMRNDTPELVKFSPAKSRATGKTVKIGNLYRCSKALTELCDAAMLERRV